MVTESLNVGSESDRGFNFLAIVMAPAANGELDLSDFNR